MNFQTTDRALLHMIRQSLFDGEIADCTLTENEWKSLVAHADALGVSLMVFQSALSLSPIHLPKYLPDAWSELVHLKNERSEAILAEEALLANTFKAKRIPLLFLADTAAAAYYPSPSLRTVRGTDCLSDRPIKEIADSLDFAYPFTEKQDLPVEKGEGMEAIRLRSLLARALDASVSADFGAHTLPVPSVTLQALLLLLTAEKKPSLLLLADWAVLTQYAFRKHDVNLAMQVRTWEQCGLLTTAKKLSCAATLAFDLETAEWFEDADKENAAQLLADILIPDEAKLSRAEKNLDIAIARAARPPKAPPPQKKKKSPAEKNAISRFFGGLFGKK